MKFYVEKNKYFYWREIYNNKLTAIYSYYNCLFKFLYIIFLKNGEKHNCKNAAYISYDEYKQFVLNNEVYGSEKGFTKQSWRRFIKMQAFL
jgi:hypothetical protein